MFCRKCGKYLLEGDRFCSYCGAQVIERSHGEGSEDGTEEIIYNHEPDAEQKAEHEELSMPEKTIAQTWQEISGNTLYKRPHWNLEGFPAMSGEPRKTEDIRVDWKNRQMLRFENMEESGSGEKGADLENSDKQGDASDKSDNPADKRQNTDKLENDEKPAKSEKTDIFEIFDRQLAEEKKAEIEKKEAEKAELEKKEEPKKQREELKNKDTLIFERTHQNTYADQLEKELFHPDPNLKKYSAGKGGIEEQIDKFYTFSQKNEEFQKLLDKEYERLKNGPDFVPPKPKQKMSIDEPQISVLDTSPAELQKAEPEDRQLQKTEPLKGEPPKAETSKTENRKPELPKDALPAERAVTATAATVGASAAAATTKPLRKRPEIEESLTEILNKVEQMVKTTEVGAQNEADAQNQHDAHKTQIEQQKEKINEQEKIQNTQNEANSQENKESGKQTSNTAKTANVANAASSAETEKSINSKDNENTTNFADNENAAGRETFGAESADGQRNDREPAGMGTGEPLPWDNMEAPLSEFRDDEKRASWKSILLGIVIAVIVFEICILGIRYFLPESGAAAFINDKLGAAVNWVDKINKNEDNNQKEGTEKQDEEPAGGTEGEESQNVSGEIQAEPDPNPNTDKSALVKEALIYNTNIKSVTADETLIYQENKNYGDKNINNSKTIENNIWYEDENGETVYYDKEVVKTIIQFDSTWIDYVNKKDETVLGFTKKGSKAYNNAKNFSKVGKVTESFESLKIGEIRQGGSGFYVWINEVITMVENGNETVNTHNWIYYMEPVDNELKIVNYTKF